MITKPYSRNTLLWSQCALFAVSDMLAVLDSLSSRMATKCIGGPCSLLAVRVLAVRVLAVFAGSRCPLCSLRSLWFATLPEHLPGPGGRASAITTPTAGPGGRTPATTGPTGTLI